MRRRWAFLLVFLVAACSEVAKKAEPGPSAEPAAERPATVSDEPKMKNSTLKYLANRNLKPQPTRPLNVQSHCAHKDAIGTTTKLDLLVRDAVVKTFDAQVTMKGYGTCRFNLDDFEQAEKLPQALLKHKHESGCLVRMWEQGPKVTVAFNSCPRSCEGQAFDYLWPIVVEAKSGHCY